MQFTAWLTIVIRTQQSKYLLFYAFTDSDAGAAGVGVVYLSGNQPDCYESYVYAFQCGADRADTARSDKGDQTADYRGRILCRISDCAVDLAQMQVLEKLGWIYAGIGIAALGIVLILGQVTHGSKLSWSIGGITFQPSEFVKLTFVFFWQRFFPKRQESGRWSQLESEQQRMC